MLSDWCRFRASNQTMTVAARATGERNLANTVLSSHARLDVSQFAAQADLPTEHQTGEKVCAWRPPESVAKAVLNHFQCTPRINTSGIARVARSATRFQ